MNPQVVTVLVSALATLCGTAYNVFEIRRNAGVRRVAAETRTRVDALSEALRVAELLREENQRLQNRLDKCERQVRRLVRMYARTNRMDEAQVWSFIDSDNGGLPPEDGVR